MLGAGDLGHRVVVRHHTPLGPTDVLGELTAFDEQWVVVRTEAGEERRIARHDVIAGKPIGPRPPRYSEILELERIADRAWPAPVVQEVQGWRLRFADGWTNRANSALPLGAGSLDEAVRACTAFYESRGVPPKVTVPLPARRDVARYLDDAGWITQPLVLVQTAPVPPMARADARVELTAEPSTAFLALVTARKVGLPAAADHVLRAVPAVRFAQVVDGGLLAAARGAVIDDWLHIGLVEVVPAARRQGLAQCVSATLAAWAAGLGATRAVLQVEQRNEPAVRLYQSLGFVTHHTYVTYRAP